MADTDLRWAHPPKQSLEAVERVVACGPGHGTLCAAMPPLAPVRLFSESPRPRLRWLPRVSRDHSWFFPPRTVQALSFFISPDYTSLWTASTPTPCHLLFPKTLLGHNGVSKHSGWSTFLFQRGLDRTMQSTGASLVWNAIFQVTGTELPLALSAATQQGSLT